jgi:hypothetical protein
MELGEIGNLVFAKKPHRVPEVFSKNEVRLVLQRLQEPGSRGAGEARDALNVRPGKVAVVQRVRRPPRKVGQPPGSESLEALW